MTVTSLTSTLTMLAALALTVGCNDTSGPSLPPEGGRPAEFSLVPRTATIEAGRVVALRATLVDEFGDRIPVAAQWRSSDDAVATVASTGEVYGRSEGHAIITATAAGRSQTSTIHVLGRQPKPEGKDSEPQLLRRQIR